MARAVVVAPRAAAAVQVVDREVEVAVPAAEAAVQVVVNSAEAEVSEEDLAAAWEVLVVLLAVSAAWVASEEWEVLVVSATSSVVVCWEA